MKNAIMAVAACAVVFALVGAGVGWAIGFLVPGYYRAVFPMGHETWFDPIAVGVGQGLTQGLATGIFVGVALVALYVWRDAKRGRG